MATWTKLNKPSGTSWTKVTKPLTPSMIGTPIAAGFFLYLTYTTDADSMWTKITKPAGTVWTKITKAT